MGYEILRNRAAFCILMCLVQSAFLYHCTRHHLLHHADECLLIHDCTIIHHVVHASTETPSRFFFKVRVETYIRLHIFDIYQRRVWIVIAPPDAVRSAHTSYVFKMVVTIEVNIYWGRDKMAAILQTGYSNAFSWMKIGICWFKFPWSLYLTQIRACHRTGHAIWTKCSIPFGQCIAIKFKSMNIDEMLFKGYRWILS